MTPSQTIQTEPGLLCRKVGKPDQDLKQGTDAKDSSIFEEDSSNIEDSICEEQEETDIPLSLMKTLTWIMMLMLM